MKKKLSLVRYAETAYKSKTVGLDTVLQMWFRKVKKQDFFLKSGLNLDLNLKSGLNLNLD